MRSVATAFLGGHSRGTADRLTQSVQVIDHMPLAWAVCAAFVTLRGELGLQSCQDTLHQHIVRTQFANEPAIPRRAERPTW